MPKFRIKVLEGITTGTLTKTATIDAKSKEEAHKLLMDDGNVGPMIDWDEDYDVEFDASPEYNIEEINDQ
mgnify:CR=1 FL=1